MLRVLLLGCATALAGCSDLLGPGEPKTYSGGGPLPEESEILENLKKKPPTGRYAPEDPSPAPGRTRRPRRAR